MERQVTDWEKKFCRHISDEGLVSRIHNNNFFNAKQHGKASLEKSLADSSKFSFFYLLKDTAKEMKRNPIDRKEIFDRHTVSDKGPSQRLYKESTNQ